MVFMANFMTSMTAILRVSNDTNKVIEKIDFSYSNERGTKLHINIKNIKPDTNKQTGVSTATNATDLVMTINDKDYLIKRVIHKGYLNIITIRIINLGENCEFEVVEGEEG